MFSPDDFVKKQRLNEVYRLIRWSTPPVTPKVIEFLDEQTELFAGIAYISNEKEAMDIFSKKNVIAHDGALLIISDSERERIQFPSNLTVLAVSDKYNRVFNLVYTYINQPGANYAYKSLLNIWEEIMSNPKLSTGEIWEKLRGLPDVVEPFAQLCVVTFIAPDKQKIPYKLVMKQISALLPNCHGIVRNNEVILLITYRERRFDYPFDLNPISGILKKYNGYMSISNGTRDLSALRVLYYLARRIITLALELNISPEARIFTFEGIGEYLTIDLCAIGFQTLTKSDGLLYLAHPAVVALKRYDKENNDDLLETLFCYLSNDRSVAVTAAMLHMHRNTVMNKIKKIRQQFKLDLGDRQLRQRLIFSCKLAKYYESINKLRPDLLTL